MSSAVLWTTSGSSGPRPVVLDRAGPGGIQGTHAQALTRRQAGNHGNF